MDMIKQTIPTGPVYTYGYSHAEGALQRSQMTANERYPKILDAAKRLKPGARRVLSFGCATGEEAGSLHTRFPEAEVVGVDIDQYAISQARKKHKNVHFHDSLGALGKFDVITALNVFFSLQSPVPRNTWEKTLRQVSTHLAPGGVILMFKSDYNPKEVLGNGFKDLNVWMHQHN